MLPGKSLFKFLDDAKTALGITLKKYINNSPTVQSQTSANSDDLNPSPSLAEELSCLMQNQLLELVNKGLSLLGSNVNPAELLIEFCQKRNDTALTITEQLYSWIAQKVGISSSVLGFIELTIAAMQRLD